MERRESVAFWAGNRAWGLINCFPKSFEDEGSSRRKEGEGQASSQAGRAANELGHQVVIKEKSPASGLPSTHPLSGAASGFLTLQAFWTPCPVPCPGVLSEGVQPWLGGGVAETLVSGRQIGKKRKAPGWRQYRSQGPHREEGGCATQTSCL